MTRANAPRLGAGWRMPWRRRRPDITPDITPDQSLGWALVHLGIAIRAHQNGDILLAVRHLAMAAETITALIEQWAAPSVAEEAVEAEEA